MITIFEKFINNTRNFGNPDFWEMVDVADWNSVISEYIERDGFHNVIRPPISDKAKIRLCLNYTYPKIKEFDKEYNVIYNRIYKHFEPFWLTSHQIEQSNDGYSDLISSVIGKGKKFVEMALNNENLVIEMSKKQEFVENFGYLLNIDEEDYEKIRIKYDPYYLDTRNYNV